MAETTLTIPVPDWTIRNETEPFFNLKTGQHSITVDKAYETGSPDFLAQNAKQYTCLDCLDDLQDLLERYTAYGVDQLISYYNKDVDSSLRVTLINQSISELNQRESEAAGSSYIISTRSNTPIKVLVTLVGLNEIPDKAPSDYAEENYDEEDLLRVTYLNWEDLDKKVKFVIKRFRDKYIKEIKNAQFGNLRNFNLETETTKLEDFINPLQNFFATNGFQVSDLTSPIEIVILTEDKCSLADVKYDGVSLRKGFNKLTKNLSSHTASLTYWIGAELYSLLNAEFREEREGEDGIVEFFCPEDASNPSWEKILKYFCPVPVPSSTLNTSPVGVNQTIATFLDVMGLTDQVLNKTINGAGALGSVIKDYTQKTLEDRILHSPEYQEAMMRESEINNVLDYIDDSILNDVGRLKEDLRSGDLQDLFRILLSSVELKFLVAWASSCLNIDEEIDPCFLDFFNLVLSLSELQLPDMDSMRVNFDLDLWTVDLLKSLLMTILETILAIIVSMLLDPVLDLLSQIELRCDEELEYPAEDLNAIIANNFENAAERNAFYSAIVENISGNRNAENIAAFTDLLKDLGSLLTAAELCSLFKGQISSELLPVLQSIISQEKYVAFQDRFETQEDIRSFFISLGKLADLSICEEKVVDFSCLDNFGEEKRKELLSGCPGLSQSQIDDQIARERDRRQQTLDNFSDLLEGDNALQKMMDDYLQNGLTISDPLIDGMIQSAIDANTGGMIPVLLGEMHKDPETSRVVYIKKTKPNGNIKAYDYGVYGAGKGLIQALEYVFNKNLLPEYPQLTEIDDALSIPLSDTYGTEIPVFTEDGDPVPDTEQTPTYPPEDQIDYFLEKYDVLAEVNPTEDLRWRVKIGNEEHTNWDTIIKAGLEGSGYKYPKLKVELLSGGNPEVDLFDSSSKDLLDSLTVEALTMAPADIAATQQEYIFAHLMSEKILNSDSIPEFVLDGVEVDADAHIMELYTHLVDSAFHDTIEHIFKKLMSLSSEGIGEFDHAGEIVEDTGLIGYHQYAIMNNLDPNGEGSSDLMAMERTSQETKDYYNSIKFKDGETTPNSLLLGGLHLIARLYVFEVFMKSPLLFTKINAYDFLNSTFVDFIFEWIKNTVSGDQLDILKEVAQQLLDERAPGEEQQVSANVDEFGNSKVLATYKEASSTPKADALKFLIAEELNVFCTEFQNTPATKFKDSKSPVAAFMDSLPQQYVATYNSALQETTGFPLFVPYIAEGAYALWPTIPPTIEPIDNTPAQELVGTSIDINFEDVTGDTLALDTLLEYLEGSPDLQYELNRDKELYSGGNFFIIEKYFLHNEEVINAAELHSRLEGNVLEDEPDATFSVGLRLSLIPATNSYFSYSYAGTAADIATYLSLTGEFDTSIADVAIYQTLNDFRNIDDMINSKAYGVLWQQHSPPKYGIGGIVGAELEQRFQFVHLIPTIKYEMSIDKPILGDITTVIAPAIGIFPAQVAVALADVDTVFEDRKQDLMAGLNSEMQTQTLFDSVFPIEQFATTQLIYNWELVSKLIKDVEGYSEENDSLALPQSKDYVIKMIENLFSLKQLE